MGITKNVILDILPLYLANEVSADTRDLVENYLETDPELDKIVKQSAEMELQGEIPVPLTEEDKMKTYRKTKWLMILTIVILAVLIAFILGVTLLAFFVSV
jgi:t-SNARE complex subunit (syntaxin)